MESRFQIFLIIKVVRLRILTFVFFFVMTSQSFGQTELCRGMLLLVSLNLISDLCPIALGAPNLFR